MAVNKVRILDSQGIRARLKRMAFEIYEANYLEKELVVVGIDERGGYLAEQLVEALREISPLEVHYAPVQMDRGTEDSDIGIELEFDFEEFAGKPIVVVDDVLYTGTTLLNVVAILLQAGPSTIQTAVLIDRGHRKFPVSSDFVGIELATTIQQHVSVVIAPEENHFEAFLS
ncbi:phosphoribosyltransferase family protein [Pontibacter sp. G13]|uniref:phosphoribosyltransferase family protein n=1 Tax=Pontibacter sp. G13 TaxID=3074898 RepID=UPI00288B926B|nr:phosphoribosyltransferase family protein [Pontibacter sp. G13]WNJ16927.1 phosphoribosyltransferase family protein [Pontibacter sp. G13]